MDHKFVLIQKYNVTDKQNAEICEICESQILNVYTIENTETGETFKCGSACCKKLTGYTPSGLSRNHQMFLAEVMEEEEVIRVKNWIVANEEILGKLEKMTGESDHYWPMAEDFYNNAVKSGHLTEKQLSIIEKQSTKDFTNKSGWIIASRNLFVLGCCRLAKFDVEIVRDLNHYSEWGISNKQAQMIEKMINKYRKQISQDEWLIRIMEREITE